METRACCPNCNRMVPAYAPEKPSTACCPECGFDLLSVVASPAEQDVVPEVSVPESPQDSEEAAPDGSPQKDRKKEYAWVGLISLIAGVFMRIIFSGHHEKEAPKKPEAPKVDQRQFDSQYLEDLRKQIQQNDAESGK